jgi:hypothetical protein
MDVRRLSRRTQISKRGGARTAAYQARADATSAQGPRLSACVNSTLKERQFTLRLPSLRLRRIGADAPTISLATQLPSISTPYCYFCLDFGFIFVRLPPVVVREAVGSSKGGG